VGALLDGYHAGMPSPTGRTFSAEQIWIFTVRDGRIAEIRAVSTASTCPPARLGLAAPDRTSETELVRTEQVRQ
jgi:hypothetical protein